MLSFTAEVLAALLDSYNRALWPAQVAAYVLALLVVLLALGRRPGGGRLAAAVLAAGWAWTGARFHLVELAAIDFLAPVYGALFLVQAVLLAWRAIGGGLSFRDGPAPSGRAGLGFVAYALLAFPVIAAVADGGFSSAAIVGLTPAPTAVFTLGVLLLAAGRTPWHLAVIPVLWCLIAGAVASQLGITADLPLPVLGVAALGLIARNNRRHEAG